MKTKTTGRERPKKGEEQCSDATLKRGRGRARKAAQAGPLASIATAPGPEAPAPETAASGRPVGAPAAGGIQHTAHLPDGKVMADADEPVAEREAVEAATQEAHRLAFALSKKPRDRQRAKALVTYIEANPRIERNSRLHAMVEAAVRLLAEMAPPATQKRGEVRRGGQGKSEVQASDLTPKPEAPASADHGLSAGALELLRAVFVACEGKVDHRVDYATVSTPNFSAKQRTGYTAALLRKKYIRTHWAPKPKIEIELSASGQAAAQANG